MNHSVGPPGILDVGVTHVPAPNDTSKGHGGQPPAADAPRSRRPNDEKRRYVGRYYWMTICPPALAWYIFYAILAVGGLLLVCVARVR